MLRVWQYFGYYPPYWIYARLLLQICIITMLYARSPMVAVDLRSHPNYSISGIAKEPMRTRR